MLVSLYLFLSRPQSATLSFSPSVTLSFKISCLVFVYSSLFFSSSFSLSVFASFPSFLCALPKHFFEMHLISAGLVVRVKLNCRDTRRMEVNSSIKTGRADNWAGFSFPCMIKMPVDRALSASENAWESDRDFSFFFLREKRKRAFIFREMKGREDQPITSCLCTLPCLGLNTNL